MQRVQHLPDAGRAHQYGRCHDTQRRLSQCGHAHGHKVSRFIYLVRFFLSLFVRSVLQFQTASPNIVYLWYITAKRLLKTYYFLCLADRSMSLLSAARRLRRLRPHFKSACSCSASTATKGHSSQRAVCRKTSRLFPLARHTH